MKSRTLFPLTLALLLTGTVWAQSPGSAPSPHHKVKHHRHHPASHPAAHKHKSSKHKKIPTAPTRPEAVPSSAPAAGATQL